MRVAGFRAISVAGECRRFATRAGRRAINLSVDRSALTWDVRFGVDNLFDKEPPVIGNDPVSGDTNSDTTNPGYYDILGQRWFMGLKVSF